MAQTGLEPIKMHFDPSQAATPPFVFISSVGVILSSVLCAYFGVALRPQLNTLQEEFARSVRQKHP